MGKALVLNPEDNVATALTDLESGEAVQVKVSDVGTEKEVVSRAQVPFGHKIALERVNSGGEVIKYGANIGLASENIEIGDHVHTHNVESRKGRGDKK